MFFSVFLRAGRLDGFSNRAPGRVGALQGRRLLRGLRPGTYIDDAAATSGGGARPQGEHPREYGSNGRKRASGEPLTGCGKRKNKAMAINRTMTVERARAQYLKAASASKRGEFGSEAQHMAARRDMQAAKRTLQMAQLRDRLNGARGRHIARPMDWNEELL